MIVGVFDLLPLVGATIAAAIVGIVTLFYSFPTDTIVWVIVVIVYQQIENNVLSPIMYRRTVQVPGMLVLVSVLIGATLSGVIGALWRFRLRRPYRSSCATCGSNAKRGRRPLSPEGPNHRTVSRGVGVTSSSDGSHGERRVSRSQRWRRRLSGRTEASAGTGVPVDHAVWVTPTHPA